MMAQDQLNKEQRRATEHVEGPLFILAGAGSGKTRIVTHRIAHLLNMGVPASSILALTFTNKAATEMRERIRKMASTEVLTCTFHSLCARILRESIHHLGFTNDFAIYDADDSIQLIRNCLKILEIKEEKGMSRTLQSEISRAKNDMVAPNDLPEPKSWDKMANSYKAVYNLYQQKLKEYNALDFDDLLYLTAHLFTTHPEILTRYQNQWQFILVDEYQDTNHAQYRIIQQLASAHQNLCVVGDPDQSIYSWRGADIRNILNFQSDYPDAKAITLDQNYRSTNNILNAANALIRHNMQRQEKNLWSALGDGNKIGLYKARSDLDEADYVHEKLMHHHHGGIALKESVIFYRTNAQSRIFEDMLLKYKIPYVIVGGVSFYQRREIKDILAYLRMLVSDADFLSFARTINLPKRGIGPTTLAKLAALAESQTTPILALCREYPLKVSKRQQEGINSYLSLISSLRNQTNLPLEDLIVSAIEQSGYLNVLKEDPESFEDRKANLDELIAKAAEWRILQTKPTLTSFLEEITLTTSAESTPSDDAVQLMTLHNGKGLEFDLTFVVGLEENLCPHLNSIDDPTAVEEERRLLYVGMTRAKQHLYLSCSRYRFLWGTPRTMEPSRFLRELPEECLDDASQMPGDVVYDEEPQGFPPGTLVKHQDFGVGTVKKLYNTSHGPAYDVHFNESGITRSLVAKYAKLEKWHNN